MISNQKGDCTLHEVGSMENTRQDQQPRLRATIGVYPNPAILSHAKLDRHLSTPFQDVKVKFQCHSQHRGTSAVGDLPMRVS